MLSPKYVCIFLPLQKIHGAFYTSFPKDLNYNILTLVYRKKKQGKLGPSVTVQKMNNPYLLTKIIRKMVVPLGWGPLNNQPHIHLI